MIKLVENIIQNIKKDDSYRINSNFNTKQLFYILFYRTLQIFRGFLVFFKFNRISGLVFLGRHVVIEHGYQIRSGKGLIIEDYVHINALSKLGIQLGDNVTISKNTIIVCTGVISNIGEGIKIGNNVGINAMCFLGGQGYLEINDDVIIGPGVKIFTENHKYSSFENVIRKQGEIRKSVCIERNCWIGAGSVILAGCNIGEGTVIAAGSVVTKNVPPNVVYGGIPAKFIKERINEIE